MQILYDLIFFIFDCHGVQLSQLGVLGRGRPSWHEGGRRTVMLPDSDEWRTEVFLRVRPFKDEFRPQTVRISENGRRWINIQNLDPNPDILVQIWFFLIIDLINTTYDKIRHTAFFVKYEYENTTYKLFKRVRPDTTYDLFQKYEVVSIRGPMDTRSYWDPCIKHKC